MENIAKMNYKSLTKRDFLKIADLAYNTFGISLYGDSIKRIEYRVFKIMAQLKLKSFSELYELIFKDLTRNTLLRLIDELTINYSYFYREPEHYDFLKNLIKPGIWTSLNRELRIWSAGCAGGEEPYTLAMVADEAHRSLLTGTSVKILATDISVSSLARAQLGIYGDKQASRLPEEYKKRYFTELAEQRLKINEPVKRMVTFRRLNLMGKAFPFKNKFDIIFCRNVLIYFDSQSRSEVIRKMVDNLADGGYLIIGHSESLSKRDRQGLTYLMPSIYQKNLISPV